MDGIPIDRLSPAKRARIMLAMSPDCKKSGSAISFPGRIHEGVAMRPEHVLFLKRDTLLRIHAIAGRKIVCVRGIVWLTQEGDRRDFVLAPGATLVLDRAGIALAWAGGDAVLALDEALHAEQVRHAAKRRFHAADTLRDTIDAIVPRYHAGELATLPIDMRNAIVQREAKRLRDQVISALLRSVARGVVKPLRRLAASLLPPALARTALRRAE
jgi:hypothetical protein